MQKSAEAIRSGAMEYNREHPEAAAQIEAGEPVVQVLIMPAAGLGRQVRVLVVPVVELPGGGVAWAAEPIVRWVSAVRPGSLRPKALARRLAAELAGVEVPIRWVER